MAKAKKDKIGTIDEDLEKWKNKDIDEIPEEQLEKIGTNHQNFNKRIGYGTRSVFLMTLSKKYYQLIKTEDFFLFHYIGKAIYKNNCLAKNHYINIEELDKNDFVIMHQDIKKIIIDCESFLYRRWGKIKFKKVNGKTKSFGLEESCGYYRHKEFFADKLKIKRFYLLDFSSWSWWWQNRKN